MKKIPLYGLIVAMLYVIVSCNFFGGNDPEDYGSMIERITDSLSGGPEGITVYGGALYFSADDGSSGRELWKYDPLSGTAGLVDDINAGLISSNPQGFTVFSSELYFQADDGDSGRELWKYGGSGDAQLVADLNSGSNSSIPKDFAVFANELYFYALASVPPVLHRCDESDQCSAAAGVTTSYPSDLVSYGTELYYQGRDGDRELWAYDGSSERKINIGDDTASLTSGSPTGMAVFDGRLYFSAAGDGSDYELWVYDDAWTDAQEKPINLSGPSNPAGFTVYGGAVYFSADGGGGVELWRCSSGGDPEAVEAVNGEVELGLPVAMTVFDGKLYFVADDGVHGMELWSYDGISSPVLVEDIYEGAESSNPAYLTVYDNALYFAADNGLGLQLWKMIF